VGVVIDAVGLAGDVAGADLVLTGEGSFDGQSLRGKVVAGVAATARGTGTPCLVLAGQVGVEPAAAAAAGVRAAYSLAEQAGSVAAALAEPARQLTELAARVALDWHGGRVPEWHQG